MCVTDRHDMTLAVKVALNPNQPIFANLNKSELYRFQKMEWLNLVLKG